MALDTAMLPLYWLWFMLSVTNKPIMLSVNMSNAIMLNVIMLSVVTPYFLLL
jgi:hypothetical protein